MTSLRELIERKARRTAQLPVLVGDASGTARAVADAVSALQAHQREVAGREDPEALSDEDKATEQRLRDDVTSALAAQQQTVVLVELQALDSHEWDAVFGDIEPDADGTIPLDDYRAALLAACCVDEGLRDAAWWEQQLARPEWTKGDKINADNVLLGLNLHVPKGPLGKG